MLNPNSSNVKKWIALLLVSAVAATAVPSAALGEEDVSGELTVGVVITEEQCDGTASIAIAQQDNATGRLELEFQEAQAPNQDRTLFQHISDSIRYPWELVVMDTERINESFQGTMVSNLEMDLFSLTSIQYATLEDITNNIIQIHPADLNGDGLIDLVYDVHPVSRETSYLYKSVPFALIYDAGSCDSTPVLGAVDVRRTALINEIDGTDAELDLYGPVPEGAKGVAFLSKEMESQDFLPDFYAVMPVNDPVPFIDYVSFGEVGQESLYVELALVGEFLVGDYQTQFTFNLETNTADHWETYVPAFCKILNPDWFDGGLCAGP